MYIRIIVVHIPFLSVRHVLVPPNLFIERVLRILSLLVSYWNVRLYHSVYASRVSLREGENTILFDQLLIVAPHFALKIQVYVS